MKGAGSLKIFSKTLKANEQMPRSPEPQPVTCVEQISLYLMDLDAKSKEELTEAPSYELCHELRSCLGHVQQVIAKQPDMGQYYLSKSSQCTSHKRLPGQAKNWLGGFASLIEDVSTML